MKRFVTVLVFVAVCAVASQAGVVFYDDFEDGVVNTNIWKLYKTGTGSCTETGGQMLVQSFGGNWGDNYMQPRAYANSNPALLATLNAGEKVVLSTSYMNWSAWQPGNFIGLNLTGANQIVLRTGEVGGVDYGWFKIMMKKDNGASQELIIHPGNEIYGGFALEWSENRVVVRTTEFGVIFDSANPAKNGGITWAVPAVGTSLFADIATITNSTLAFNDLKYETMAVPEPATLFVLGLGSLLLRRRIA